MNNLGFRDIACPVNVPDVVLPSRKRVARWQRWRRDGLRPHEASLLCRRLGRHVHGLIVLPGGEVLRVAELGRDLQNLGVALEHGLLRHFVPVRVPWRLLVGLLAVPDRLNLAPRHEGHGLPAVDEPDERVHRDHRAAILVVEVWLVGHEVPLVVLVGVLPANDVEVNRCHVAGSVHELDQPLVVRDELRHIPVPVLERDKVTVPPVDLDAKLRGRDDRGHDGLLRAITQPGILADRGQDEPRVPLLGQVPGKRVCELGQKLGGLDLLCDGQGFCARCR